MTKLIIDTDIGDDIDDALAVAFALKSPEIDLIGITTVYKNTKLRSKLALKLLEVYGRNDIPAAAGVGMPLINRVDCSSIPCQYKAVDGEMKLNTALNAVDFIIDKVENNNDITIVTIGALTNLAAAVIQAPEVMKKAKVVIMGGMVSNPYPEGNINTDPEAAAIVFNSGIDITMVGLHVTLKCNLSAEQVAEFDKAEKRELKFLSKLIHIWKLDYLAPILRGWGMKIEEDFETGITLHDPLAVAYLLDPSLFKVKSSKILIETKGEYTRGVTVDSINVFNGQQNGCNADVCVDVDFERFIKMFMGRVLGKKS